MKWNWAGLLFVFVMVSCGDDGTLQDKGTLGAPCYPDGTCVAGLTCEAELCIETPVCATDEDCHDSNICTVDSCDLTRNECVYENQDVPCDDADLCTVSDICVEGVCTAGEVVVCEDQICADSVTCVPSEGCVAAWLPDGAECDDGNLCTELSACDGAHNCVGGADKPCDDFDPCTADSCDAETGECVHELQLVACDDGSLCTIADICQEDGTCLGIPVDCSGVDGACLLDLCNPETGACDLARPDGTLCGDTDLCNGQEACAAGECVAGPAVECPPTGTLCTLNICEGSTGTCTEVIEPNCCGNNIVESGEFCDDGNQVVEVCLYGETACTVCNGDCLEQAGATAYCGDGVTNVSAGETCDDGNAVGGDCCGETCIVEAPGTLCRAAADICDVDETCDGVAASCPEDVVESAGTVCRVVAGDCDVVETCTGSAVACPVDAKTAAGTLCRAATDDCDVDENCDGVGDDCPEDELAATGAVCRAAVDDCDVDENCDGVVDSCPDDELAAAGAVCRAAADVCDVEETCDGVAASCRDDVLIATGTVCRVSDGDCDVEEACDGVASSCPDDVLIADGTVCRVSAGDCDVDEACDGIDVSCPVDDKIVAGDTCRASTGVCDIEEACDGVSDTCTADEFFAAGLECDDGDEGTKHDACDGAGVCVGVVPVCGDAEVDDGEECDDGNIDDNDGCSSGCLTEICGPGAFGEECTLSGIEIELVDDGTGDAFGQSIAISGDTMAVADRFGGDGGTVYIYTRVAGVWELQTKIDTPVDFTDWHFGRSVDLDGDTLVVGAPGATADVAYIFTRSGTEWTQQAKLEPIGAVDVHGLGVDFGYSVAISGDTVVVGAYNDDHYEVESGAAFVFVRSGTAWTQEAKIVADDGNNNDEFGFWVGISGDSIVAGARYDDDNGVNSGSAYVFTRVGAVWTQEAKLLASDGQAYSRYGSSVSISGDALVVGAPKEEGDNGVAYVYTRLGAIWTEQKLSTSAGIEDAQFGVSVSVTAETLVVGAYRESFGVSSTGSVYVYNLVDGLWTEQHKLTRPAGIHNDNFGYRVAVDGDVLAVGSDPADDTGFVYVYEDCIVCIVSGTE